MNFSYKVIKNRLGSLVANAIQKTTKDEIESKIKVNFTSNASFSWNRPGTLSNNSIYEISDIKVYSGDSISNINVFVIGSHSIAKAGNFWVHDGVKIEGTTSNTLISDPILFDLVKQDIAEIKYFIMPNLSSLNAFQIYCRSVNCSTIIDGYTYKFPTINQMQTLLTQ